LGGGEGVIRIPVSLEHQEESL